MQASLVIRRVDDRKVLDEYLRLEEESPLGTQRLKSLIGLVQRVVKVQPCVRVLARMVDKGCVTYDAEGQPADVDVEREACARLSLLFESCLGERGSSSERMTRDLHLAMDAGAHPVPEAAARTLALCSRLATADPQSTADCYARGACRAAWTAYDACLHRTLGDRSSCTPYGHQFQACMYTIQDASVRIPLQRLLEQDI